MHPSHDRLAPDTSEMGVAHNLRATLGARPAARKLCTCVTSLMPWQVGGIDWFAREQRGMQALYAPEWKDPEKTVLSLRNLEVRPLMTQSMYIMQSASIPPVWLHARPGPAFTPIVLLSVWLGWVACHPS